jgi:hypothetical protein
MKSAGGGSTFIGGFEGVGGLDGAAAGLANSGGSAGLRISAACASTCATPSSLPFPISGTLAAVEGRGGFEDLSAGPLKGVLRS